MGVPGNSQGSPLIKSSSHTGGFGYIFVPEIRFQHVSLVSSQTLSTVRSLRVWGAMGTYILISFKVASNSELTTENACYYP